ncbi:MAG TPA: hypothetical protein VFQ44_17940 [Streptosporangiaceae bacterium]|nr:hypothetical protein [Streptosporangiaceae bacterium]
MRGYRPRREAFVGAVLAAFPSAPGDGNDPAAVLRAVAEIGAIALHDAVVFDTGLSTRARARLNLSTSAIDQPAINFQNPV